MALMIRPHGSSPRSPYRAHIGRTLHGLPRLVRGFTSLRRRPRFRALPCGENSFCRALRGRQAAIGRSSYWPRWSSARRRCARPCWRAARRVVVALAMAKGRAGAHPHFLLHVLPSGFHRIRHMWTASWQVGFDALIALVGCGHMSGLLVRYRTAGPDDIRQSWSLSLRRARGSWRMSGCPGLSLRPCRSSRRCACQSLRN